ncbi:hypothetical protein ACWEO4_18590 [Streptomyces sp. NPDC004393]
MTDVDAGGGDRLALMVLTQYRMATTEHMHRVIAPEVRIRADPAAAGQNAR